MFCFLRALRLGRLAGFLGALSFAFAGAMSAQVSHFGLVAGMSWVPLVLLAILRLCQDSPARGARFRWIAVLAVSSGLVILAGEPRAVDDALVIVLGYAAWMIARLGRDWFRAAVSVAAGLALGACLGAVQWLPGLAAVSTSQRAGGSTALFDSGSLPVRWLLLTLVPDLLGGSGSLRQPAFFAGYNLTEVTSYVGILPLVAAFALLGRLRPGRRGGGGRGSEGRGSGGRAGRGLSRWPEWIVWHVIGLAGALLALGGNTPLGACSTGCPCSAASGCRAATFSCSTWLSPYCSPTGPTSRRRRPGRVGDWSALPAAGPGRRRSSARSRRWRWRPSRCSASRGARSCCTGLGSGSAAPPASPGSCGHR